jgi:ABC-2 type transport system permease protein
MYLNKIFNKKNTVLLKALIVTDFKLRYQGSSLGYAWSLIKPLFLFAIMYIVFGLMIRIGSIEHYAVYLLVGVVLWNFFTESTQQGMNSIISRSDLLRKISFPKYIIVISATFSALINLALNFIIITILILLNGIQIGSSLAVLPLYLIELYLLSLGLAFFLSALNVKFRDTSHIWEIVMQAAFYATPIIYPLSLIADKSDMLAKLIILNPVAQSIQGIRFSLVTKETATIFTYFSNPLFMIVPIIITLSVFIFGAIYFKKSSEYFAERV